MKLTFKKAYQNFLKTINVGELSVEDLNLKAIMKSVKMDYSEVEILGLDLDNPDCDMLLFEYGNYDWTGEGEKFNLSVKRQLFFENLDECGYYGFTIYFDKNNVGEIDEFSKWCEKKSDADEWLSEIEKTIGIEKVEGKPAMKFEFELEKPN
ncbi:hypothetical protein [Gaetbulibacter sp. PBL-D1]|uniref:hypothetical protein n=1 Tax=Gaetbulibacter sp. PBL-D1 TaxID=3422594 RepID=UPI003D2F407F